MPDACAQVAPLSMYEEKNTGSNLPAQVDLYATQARGRCLCPACSQVR